MPGQVAAQPERGKPVADIASRIAPIKCSVAGQPEYVGVKPITHPLPSVSHYAPCLNQ